MRKLIARISIVLVPLGLMFGLGMTSAHASWWALCNKAPTQLCMYANGTDGHDVYGKLFSSNSSSESGDLDTIYAPGCSTNPDHVQDGADGDDNCNGVSTWWPFATHSYDTNLGDGQVMTVGNLSNNNCFVATVLYNDLTQDNSSGCTAAGHEWIELPLGGGWVSYENVYIIGAVGGNAYICAPSTDSPLVTTDQTGGHCGAQDSSKLNWGSFS